MADNQQSSALTPTPLPWGEGFVLCPSPAVAGEGSIVTEMVDNHFRKTQ
jgi:hypothetical protein